ncbi:MAG: aminotransferase class I/II-fold pyridoxal phosphate-dependent enzyme [Thermodesulfobacteriota bacterium]
MNPIAQELNDILAQENPHVLEMLSSVGKNLFFPKGILAQSAEAKQKAHRFNATIGIATEKGKPLHLPSVMGFIRDIPPEQCLTYAPSFGLPELRKIWKASLFDKNPSLAGKKVSTPVVTQALTHGIAVVGDMWIDPGDVVILPKIFWGNYGLILSVRRGARFSHYNLFSDKGGLDLESFEDTVRAEAAKNQKITVLLNFPQNPTGYTATKAEGQKIAEILLSVAEGGTNVVVVCDDAYFGLFFDPDCLQESVFALLAQKHERLCAIKLDGATKEDFVWGLRVGFVTYGVKFAGNDEQAYEALEKKTAGAVRGSISNASHLSQTIVLKAMASPAYALEKAEKREILKARALKVKEVLADPAYESAWEPYPFNSGYFMCLKLKTVDAEPLRVHLLDKYGVGLISLGKSELRVAFSCLEVENVKELFDIVLAGVRDLEQAD